MTVPMTTLTRATSAEPRTVGLREGHEAGVVTCRQTSAGPAFVPRQTTAASGMSTIRLRYVTARPSPVRRVAIGLLGVRGDAEFRLDRGDQAGRRVEEVLAHLRPATEV